jgi:hypothetical protein
MPFRSARQRRWMFANKPRLAKEWAKKYGTKPKGNGRKKTRRRKK